MQLQFVICLVGLALCVVNAQVDEQTSKGCEDKSENCSDIVSRGACHSVADEDQEAKLGCARSCGLCEIIDSVETFFRVQRGRVNTRPRSAPRQQANHPRQQVNRPRQQVHRPNVRSANRRPNVRATKARSRRPVARRPANKRRPQTRSKSRQQTRQNGPRKSSQKKPQQVHKPKLGAGTVSGSNGQKLIGPNEIKVPKKAIALSELAEASNLAQTVSARYVKMTQETDEILKGLDEALKLIAEEKQAKISSRISRLSFGENGTVINGETGDGDEFKLVQTNAKFFGSIGKWIPVIGSVVTHAKNLVTDVSHTIEDGKKLYAAVQKHDFSLDSKDNFWSSLGTFAVDLTKSVKDAVQIYADVNPELAGLSKVLDMADKAVDIAENMNDIEKKIADAKNTYTAVRKDIVSAGQSFKTIADDFKSAVDTASKGKDLPAPRKPLYPEGDKTPAQPKPEPKQPEQPKSKDPEPKPVPKQPKSKDPEPKPEPKQPEQPKVEPKQPEQPKAEPKQPEQPEQKPQPPKDPYEEQMKKPAIALKSFHNFMSSESETAKVSCNKAVAGTTERFHLIELSNNKVAFRASNNKFCAFTEDPHGVVCNKDSPDHSTEFGKIVEGDRLAFECPNGKKLTSDGADPHILVCKVDKVDRFERFEVVA